MSRSMRIVLLFGCGGLGALHLPAATQALSDGLASPVREVRAGERAAAAERSDGRGDELLLDESLAQRD